MQKKKSSFLTFIFSFLPGAGHMYMGLMKEGLSFLSLFFFTIFLGSWLNMGPIMFILPVIWFYAFFDALNKMSLPDHVFADLNDDYLFNLDQIFSRGPEFIVKNRIIVAIALIFIGLTILWNNFVHILYSILPEILSDFISNFTYVLPQIIFAFAVIYIGLKMIVGKKNDLEKENSDKKSSEPKRIFTQDDDKEMK